MAMPTPLSSAIAAYSSHSHPNSHQALPRLNAVSNETSLFYSGQLNSSIRRLPDHYAMAWGGNSTGYRRIQDDAEGCAQWMRASDLKNDTLPPETLLATRMPPGTYQAPANNCSHINSLYSAAKDLSKVPIDVPRNASMFPSRFVPSREEVLSTLHYNPHDGVGSSPDNLVLKLDDGTEIIPRFDPPVQSETRGTTHSGSDFGSRMASDCNTDSETWAQQNTTIDTMQVPVDLLRRAKCATVEGIRSLYDLLWEAILAEDHRLEIAISTTDSPDGDVPNGGDEPIEDLFEFPDTTGGVNDYVTDHPVLNQYENVAVRPQSGETHFRQSYPDISQSFGLGQNTRKRTMSAFHPQATFQNTPWSNLEDYDDWNRPEFAHPSKRQRTRQ